MGVITKICTKCGAEKPLEGFHRQAAGKHGRFPSCKECVNAHVFAYRQSLEAEVKKAAKKSKKEAKENDMSLSDEVRRGAEVSDDAWLEEIADRIAELEAENKRLRDLATKD